VKPFGICYEASAFFRSLLFQSVAKIDMMLHGGRNWTLPGASSLVPVNEQIVCFAFLEMGSATTVPKSRRSLLGPGGYQMENMLLFDLEKGTFGVSGFLYDFGSKGCLHGLTKVLAGVM